MFPLALAFSSTFLQVALTQIFGGFSLGAGFPSIQSYIIEIAGPDNAGQYSGLYYVFWGVFTW